MARLGTPENPEIITPGGAPALSARLRTFVSLLRGLVFVVTPALIFDSSALWLLRQGWHEGNPLAWLLVLLIGPAAVAATVFALLGTPVLLVALVFSSFGRSISFVRVQRR